MVSLFHFVYFVTSVTFSTEKLFVLCETFFFFAFLEAIGAGGESSWGMLF